MSYIMIYKMSSGEEIIGRCVASDNDTTKVKSPFRIERIYRDDGSDGQAYYTMRSWLIGQFDDTKERVVVLSNSHIMGAMQPSNNTLNQYTSTVEYFLNPDDEISEYEEDDFENVKSTIH